MAEIVEIVVELFDEGTPTWRLAEAVSIKDGLYRILADKGYDPEDEQWAFLPGSEIRLEEVRLQNGEKTFAAIHPNPNVIRIEMGTTEEDVFGLRDAFAEKLEDGSYKVIASPHYNPDEHFWEFLPGTIVRIEEKIYPGTEQIYLTPYEEVK